MKTILISIAIIALYSCNKTKIDCEGKFIEYGTEEYLVIEEIAKKIDKLKDGGNIKDAITTSLQAIEIYPCESAFYANLANLYYKNSELIKAEKYHKIAIEIDPNHPHIYFIYYNLSNVLTDLEKHDEAKFWKDKGKSLDPK